MKKYKGNPFYSPAGLNAYLVFFFLTQVKLPMFGLFIIHERKIEKKGDEKYLKLRVGLVSAGDFTNIGHSEHVWNNYLFSSLFLVKKICRW